MKKERCNWCSTTWKDTRNDHPEMSDQQVALLVMQLLSDTQIAAHCENKKCMPYQMAEAIAKTPENPLHRQETRRSIVPLAPPEDTIPEGLQRAYANTELTILDQVYGHPDKFTAHSAVYGANGHKGCKCARCIDTYNSWVELYAQGDEEKLKLKVKKPFFPQKHQGDWDV